MRYASFSLAVCLLLASGFSSAVADDHLLSIGVSGAMLTSAAPQSIDLDLGAPEYSPCGDVSINGYVGTDQGSVTRMSWDWGDGVVADSWFPAVHHYATDGTYTVAVTAYTNMGETGTATTTVIIANATSADCDLILRLHPPSLLLRDGVVSQSLHLEIRDATGQLISPIGHQAIFTSTNPSLVQVNAAGLVTGSGFGEAEIQASVQGVARPAKARVILGRFRVTPSILLLSLASQPTGALAINVSNADGTPVNLGSHTTGFTGGTYVASVNAGGTVTAHAPPVNFGDSPYFDAAGGRPIRQQRDLRPCDHRSARTDHASVRRRVCLVSGGGSGSGPIPTAHS